MACTTITFLCQCHCVCVCVRFFLTFLYKMLPQKFCPRANTSCTLLQHWSARFLATFWSFFCVHHWAFTIQLNFSLLIFGSCSNKNFYFILIECQIPQCLWENFFFTCTTLNSEWAKFSRCTQANHGKWELLWKAFFCVWTYTSRTNRSLFVCALYSIYSRAEWKFMAQIQTW